MDGGKSNARAISNWRSASLGARHSRDIVAVDAFTENAKGGVMQRNVYGVVSFLVLAMILAAPAIQAQSRLMADVPFSFVLGDKSLAAGNYEIESRSEQVALLRNMDTSVAHFLIKAQHVQSRHWERPKLVFNRYGNEYFLSQIWDGSSDTGIQLAQSKREREASLAKNGPPERPEIVIVAMK